MMTPNKGLSFVTEEGNYAKIILNKQEVLERTNLPTFHILFKNVIGIQTSVAPT
jgi:hypothetical protein